MVPKVRDSRSLEQKASPLVATHPHHCDGWVPGPGKLNLCYFTIAVSFFLLYMTCAYWQCFLWWLLLQSASPQHGCLRVNKSTQWLFSTIFRFVKFFWTILLSFIAGTWDFFFFELFLYFVWKCLSTHSVMGKKIPTNKNSRCCCC